jgi:short-subunit dehydrogenase
VKPVVLGGTRGIGRAIARRLAERGEALFRLGRGDDDLEKSAKDLELRGARAPVRFARCDLENASSFAPALDAADAALGGFDTLILSAGAFGTQEALEADAALRARVLHVNFAATLALCEQARARLLARGGGALRERSSVAGERARKPVVLYGATKAGLSYYLDGLDLRYRDAACACSR